MTGQNHKDIFEYNQITPQIFVGTNQCCVEHFKQELLDQEIHADISLEKDKVDAPIGAEYYLWIPVANQKAPTMRQLVAGVKFMEDILDQGEKVYVHCEHGHGRAPTLVAAYFVYKDGLSPEEAFAKIKKARPSAHPTDAQMEMVKKFAERFRRKGRS